MPIPLSKPYFRLFLAGRTRLKGPGQSWYLYSLEKWRREGKDCGVMPWEWLSLRYRNAAKEGKPDDLKPIEGIRPYLTAKGKPEERQARLFSMAHECPTDIAALKQDPWGICAKAKQLRAELARKQAEEETKRMPPKDPKVCAEGLLPKAGANLGFSADQFPDTANSIDSACQVWPANPRQSLIALLVATGKPAADDAAAYDLDVAVVDSESGAVLSRFKDKASRYLGNYDRITLSIDTGRYDLAKGSRAFGVRIRVGQSPWGASWYEEVLSLFLPSGQTLRPVLRDLKVYESASSLDESDHEQCTGHSQESASRLGLGGASHQGLRDLTVTITKTEMLMEICKTSETVASKKTTGKTLRFDGQHYE